MIQEPRADDPRKVTLSRLQRYLFDILELRRTIDLNRKDAEFAARGGRIVYFADADVAFLFVDPANNTSAVEIFHGLNEPKSNNRDSRDPAARLADRFEGVPELSAAICAEYIFGGHLPGQMHQPVRICFHHSIELDAVIEREVTPRRGEWDAVEAELVKYGNDIRQTLSAAWANFSSDKEKPEKLAVELSRALPIAIGNWMIQRGVAVRQSKRLNGDLLAPATGLREFTDEIIHPRPENIDTWTKRLTASRLGGDKSSSGLLGNIVRDATVLAQIEQLNRNAEHDKVHFVLISATRGVHTAVAKWNADEHGDHVRNFVRHPRQYIAFLNLESMQSTGNAPLRAVTEAPSLLPDLESAIDTLIRYFLSEEKRKTLMQGYDLETIERELEKNVEKIQPSAIEEQLGRIQNKWSGLAQNAVLLKRNMLTEMCAVIVSLVGNIVQSASDDLDAALVDSCRTHVESISRENALTVALNVVMRLAAKRSQFPRSPAHFHHLLKLEDDLNLELNTVIARFRKNPDEAAESFRSWFNSHQTGPGQAHFVVGALLLQLDDWSGALFYLDQSQRDLERHLKTVLLNVGSLPSSVRPLDADEQARLPDLPAPETENADLLHEVLYAKIVVLRMLLAPHDLRGGMQLAQRCVHYHAARKVRESGTNFFRTARALSELAATRLAIASNVLFVTKQTKLDESRESKLVREYVEAAADEIARAQQICAQKYEQDDGERMHLRFQAIELQLLTNRAGIVILQKLWLKDKKLSHFDVEAPILFRKLEELAETHEEPKHFIPTVNYKLLEWIAYRHSNLERALNAARDALREIIENLNNSSAKITAYDRAELKFLRDKLEEYILHRGM